jgi:hypothetical protein
MGFFDALKNIALGKPVFTADQQQQKEQYNGQPHDGSGPGAPQHVGPKILPPAYIERTECRTHGDDMEVEVIIQNYSHEELVLDKIELLGKTVLMNSKRLSPGEEEEVTVYEGDRPRNTYAKQCVLYYRNEAGDYFASSHNVEYGAQMPDGTYAIRYIKFMSPIRDV